MHRKAADDSVCVFTFPRGVVTGGAHIVHRGSQPYQWIALQDTLCGWTRNRVSTCVAPPEMFGMAACRQRVGWEVLREGEEELLDLCHYNSLRSYAMLSWHWLWPDLAVGAAGAVWQCYMAQRFPPGHVAGLSLLFIEVIHPSPTYHSVLLTSLVSLSPPVTVTQPVCAGRDDNAGPCSWTSRSGSQNPTVYMPPDPATGKKVNIDPIPHSALWKASLGLPKRQGHGQRRGLQAVPGPGPQPGASMLPALGRAQPVTEVGAQCRILWVTCPRVTPNLEAAQFHVSICSTQQGTLHGSVPLGRWDSTRARGHSCPQQADRSSSAVTSSSYSLLYSCLSGRNGAFGGEQLPPAFPFKTACAALGCAWVPWSAKSARSLLKPPRWQSS